MSKPFRFISENPATQTPLWEGFESQPADIKQAITSGLKAAAYWATTSLEARKALLKRYAQTLQERLDFLSQQLAEEHGKPLWEAKTELQSTIQKVSISIEAYNHRCAEVITTQANLRSATRFKPHGLLAVLGPFNFPWHLPNGHIVPALLAGNAVIFKPSELAPRIAEHMLTCWQDAGLPKSVLQVIQGGQETGKILIEQPELAGLLFTGSASVGQMIHKIYADRPEKILALEMGGNNPLIIHDVSNLEAAAYHILISAFITSGQRCTCARRLILIDSPQNRTLLQHLIKQTEQIRIGPYDQQPQPFMGPLISAQAAQKLKKAYQALISKGAQALLDHNNLFLKKNGPETNAWLYPVILDVTPIPIQKRPDQELFGPILQISWVKDLDTAITEANQTRYGLSAGIFSENPKIYERFFQEIRAGIVNWNRPLTGASSNAPFGGIGHSGNHRPSAYFAADYCAYPVASQEETHLAMPETRLPGFS